MHTKDQIKKAWTIRKAAAAKHNVPVKFISWRSCLNKVTNPHAKLKDCYDCGIGTARSVINLFLLGPDAALIIDVEWVMNTLDIPKPKRQNARKHFADLVTAGFAKVNHNFLSLVGDKRPWPQPMG